MPYYPTVCHMANHYPKYSSDFRLLLNFFLLVLSYVIKTICKLIPVKQLFWNHKTIEFVVFLFKVMKYWLLAEGSNGRERRGQNESVSRIQKAADCSY